MRIDEEYHFALERRMYRALNRLPIVLWDKDMMAWYSQYIADMDEEARAGHDEHRTVEEVFDKARDPSNIPQTPPNSCCHDGNTSQTQEVAGGKSFTTTDINKEDAS